MKQFPLNATAVLIGALMLTACSSNSGSFETGKVSSIVTPPTTQTGGTGGTGGATGAGIGTGGTTAEPQPSYQDETSERRTIESTPEPALGYVVDIPRRHNNNDLVSIAEPTAINYDLENLPFADQLKEKSNASDAIVYSHDGGTLSRTRNFDFVRSGYVIDAEARVQFIRNEETGKRDFYQGPQGVVFYQGVTPSTILPTQSVKYQGVWDFVSDAKKGRTLPDGFVSDNQAAPANATGATPLDTYTNNRVEGAKVGHTSEFDVDFGNKTLTGKLYSNGYVPTKDDTQTVDERYSIDAKINGNRFSGTATATDSSHTVFGQNSASVEGGFFGTKAEELAGKFVTDDKSLFAAFAAKRDALDDNALQTSFDAIAINTETLAKSDLQTYGNAAYLVLDGKRISLLPEGKNRFADMQFYETFTTDHNGKTLSINVCCNNLDYVKFGSYATVNQTDGVTTLSDGSLYLIGERTDTAKIPVSGTAHYRGTWEGYIDSKDGRRWSASAGNGETSNRSFFDFDFAAKNFTGKLVAENATEDSPLFTLSGTISGNGFTGTAKTKEGGFNIDAGSTGASAIVNLNASVLGGFYGPDASEIGGIVHSNTDGEDKVGITFGGKRQVKK